MKRILLIVLALGILFSACDNGNGGEKFTSSINDSVINNVATLGIIGTTASSSDTNIATVEIDSDKIRITSVSKGTVAITVKNDSDHTATINATVLASGSITIGTITKYDTSPLYYGTWVSDMNSTQFTLSSNAVEYSDNGPSNFTLSNVVWVEHVASEGQTGDNYTHNNNYQTTGFKISGTVTASNWLEVGYTREDYLYPHKTEPDKVFLMGEEFVRQEE
jgi:hypothetical protein